MKRIYILLIVFSIQFIQAQQQDLQRANRLFGKTYYSDAIPLYEKISAKNQTVAIIQNLGDCYYYTNNYDKAQGQYSLLIQGKGKELDEDFYFRYVQTLKAKGKYAEANNIMRNFYLASNNNVAIEKLDRNIKDLTNVTALGERFDIYNLELNTPNSEFGGVVFGDNLVFAAVKKKPNLFDKTYKWSDESYLNLVSIPLKNANLKDSIVTYFSKDLKSAMHESNAVFTKDGKMMYFTRNNSKNGRRGKNTAKVSNIQIFRAEFVKNKWTNIVALPFNSPNYSVEHPALSPDEKTLYFASDMPGTLGSFDIFSVSVDGSIYGTPMNLGDKINTPKREQFPFISKDNKLYFSSNGHEGYGSLDVFVSEMQNNAFLKPSNIGLPVNSGFDDFCFNIDSESKSGYFSSNRIGGKGSDDIYELKETKPLLIEDCKQYLAGVITDVDTKMALDSSLVVLQNKEKAEIQRVVTSNDGKFSFTVECETGYTVLASKNDYTNNSRNFILKNERNKSSDASMELKSGEAIRKEEKIALDQKNKELAAALVLKDKEEALALEKAKKDKEIALKNEKALVEAKKKEKEANIVAKEKDVIKEKNRLIIKTEPIYFDYDLWYIRKDSKLILNRVVELMKKYPEMMIEIGSHTDNRGAIKYNAILSQNRANSTREYIIGQGIDPKRIVAKGYGETVQIIKCIPEESCSEEEHELNRRSEFVIKKL